MSDSDELREAIDKVLRSKSRKKLVVAGPGTGKTTLFRKLLEGTEGGPDERLVLAFINNLKADLDRSLGALATVNTLHGYCLLLLYKHASLRNGLSHELRCYPGLVSLIKTDWEWLHGDDSPTFVDHFRDLSLPETHELFYRERANYYNAVDFDDTVYRVYCGLKEHPNLIPKYALVLIDEFQDFNKMEAGVIELLARDSPITIAGDDDQALYSQLRRADWSHIRNYHGSGDYEVFELPFCMRCPEVIVGAVNDIINEAQKLKNLSGRISKPFRYFEPVKGEDSRRFPYIELIRTTVQRNNANYFGRYIEQQVRGISADEHKSAADKYEPAALVIGSRPYLPQVEEWLVRAGLIASEANAERSARDEGLEILNRDPNSNLGWRIILAQSRASVSRPIVQAAQARMTRLVDAIEDNMRESILKEAAEFANSKAETEDCETPGSGGTPPVKLASFEGSKGLSAQYVFLIGLQEGDLPRKAAFPQDIEICKFLVGLTRTKKQCTVLIAKNFAGRPKKPSLFLHWINPKRFSVTEVDTDYWKKA